MYRINDLIKLKTHLYHTRDLSLLWGITEDNTLYTRIKRYVDKGILIPIHKGFYATLPLTQIDPVLLGIGYLHRYAYISAEFVLAETGVIFQHSPTITFVSSVSKKFQVGGHYFWSRRLKDDYLFNDLGITSVNGYHKATPERALSDLLYFHPHYNLDNPKAINMAKVSHIRKEVGYI